MFATSRPHVRRGPVSVSHATQSNCKSLTVFWCCECKVWKHNTGRSGPEPSCGTAQTIRGATVSHLFTQNRWPSVECPCGGAVWLCPSRQLFGAMNLPRVMSTLTPTPRVRGGRYHYRRYCALCPTALIWLASTCSKGLAGLRPSFLAQFDWIPNRGWRNAGQHASPVPA